MLETRQKNLMQIDMNHEKNLTVVCIEVTSDPQYDPPVLLKVRDEMDFGIAGLEL